MASDKTAHHTPRSWLRTSRRTLDIAVVAVVALGVIGFVVYSRTSDPSRLPLAQTLPATMIPVASGQQAQVIKSVEQKTSVVIEVPQFVPPPANHLVAVGGDANGATQVTGFDGPTNKPITQPVAVAAMTYSSGNNAASPGTETVSIVEFDANDGLPRATGSRDDKDSTQFNELFIGDVARTSGAKARQYTFERSGNRVVIIVSGPDAPSQADIIQMDGSLRP